MQHLMHETNTLLSWGLLSYIHSKAPFISRLHTKINLSTNQKYWEMGRIQSWENWWYSKL